LGFAVCLIAFSGCRTDTTSASKRYQLSGVVLSKDQAHHTITVDAKEIPGFMAAMAMPYPVNSTAQLEALTSGDKITAEVFVQGDHYWLDNITIRSRVEATNSLPRPKFHVPEQGERVPAFRLVNQDGKHIALDDYRGKAVLLTFVYTRCPFPDFCPRITHEFAELERLLRADAALNQRTHLLTISFDPENDSPKALRIYGLPFLGNDPAIFKHWEFAVAPADHLPEIARFFGLYYEQDQGLLTHSLVAAVIAPDGRIFKWYSGNDWHANDLLKDAVAAVAQK
jgi:protein SCO1/2